MLFWELLVFLLCAVYLCVCSVSFFCISLLCLWLFAVVVVTAAFIHLQQPTIRIEDAHSTCAKRLINKLWPFLMCFVDPAVCLHISSPGILEYVRDVASASFRLSLCVQAETSPYSTLFTAPSTPISTSDPDHLEEVGEIDLKGRKSQM